jgi:hypothetical protein
MRGSTYSIEATVGFVFFVWPGPAYAFQEVLSSEEGVHQGL